MNTPWPYGFPDPRIHPTVSVDEAAGFLGIGRNLAYQGAANGTLPAIRVGKHRIRVPTAALARLLQLDPSDRPEGLREMYPQPEPARIL